MSNKSKNWVLILSFIQAFVAFVHITLLVVFGSSTYLYWFLAVNLPCALIGLCSSSWINDSKSAVVFFVATIVTLVSTLVGFIWELVLAVECFEASGISCIASVGITWAYLIIGLIDAGLCVSLVFFYSELKTAFDQKEAFAAIQKSE